uniref:Uncharacterized protein n=1 Tax=Anguilla anguilla TaxID=7936 RepID=A0A0E9WTT0_ANGAN
MCVYHNFFFFKETIMLQFKLYHLTRDHIYPLSVIADQKRRGKVRFFVSVRFFFWMCIYTWQTSQGDLIAVLEGPKVHFHISHH